MNENDDSTITELTIMFPSPCGALWCIYWCLLEPYRRWSVCHCCAVCCDIFGPSGRTKSAHMRSAH